jgi:hypothetical protein
MTEHDLTDEQYEAMMGRAAIRGFAILLLGVVTLGIGPCVYFAWQDRAAARQEGSGVA